MRFRYSLVRASIAGSFVLPIHATLIFMGIMRVWARTQSSLRDSRISLPLFPALKRRAIGRRPSGAGFFAQPVTLLSLVPTPEPRRRRSAGLLANAPPG